jgi:hypothetical protein
MSKIKYLVLPGYIKSKYDSDIHYINANTLIRLYGVKESECLIKIDNSDEDYYARSGRTKVNSNGLKLLVPLYNGNYKSQIALIWLGQ